jgi:hypothetical protein
VLACSLSHVKRHAARARSALYRCSARMAAAVAVIVLLAVSVKYSQLFSSCSTIYSAAVAVLLLQHQVRAIRCSSCFTACTIYSAAVAVLLLKHQVRAIRCSSCFTACSTREVCASVMIVPLLTVHAKHWSGSKYSCVVGRH